MADALSNPIIRKPGFWDQLLGYIPEPLAIGLQRQSEMMREDPIGYWSNSASLPLTFAGKAAKGFSDALSAGKTFKGVDGLERFEIADDMAKFNVPVKQWLGKNADGEWMAPNFGEAYTKLPNNADGPARLRDVLDHSGLYENYPELGDIGVGLTREGTSQKGMFDPTKNIIGINETLSPLDAKSTLLHEIQHAIQEKEGFARGGNPKDAADFVGDELLKASKKIRQLESNPALYEERKALDKAFSDVLDGKMTNEQFDQLFAQSKLNDEYSQLQKFRSNAPMDGDAAYRRLAGEAEARNVQSRMNMTPAERQKIKWTDTLDVPVDQQIIRFKSGQMAGRKK